MEVFEVAIGGGEPTEHPEFVEFCERLRGYGVVPNFTTRRLDWMKDGRLSALQKVCGAFAYSVESADDVTALREACEAADIDIAGWYHGGFRPVVQVALGTIPLKTVKAILHEAHDASMAITLLGFKRAGRGTQYEPADYSGWLKMVQRMKLDRLSIDTALAKEYEKKILAAGVSSSLFHTEEGRFSMYFDAVAGKVGRSSYGGDLTPVRGFWDREILPVFKGYST
jgi:hypothetical protein